MAIGEFFLKSKGVQKIFRKKLISNLSFFFAKNKIDFKILSLRERIFVETKDIEKASAILRNIFGISWFARIIFLPSVKLEEISKFIKENYKNWIKNKETFALRVKGVSGKEREEVIDRVAENIERKVNLDKPQKEIFIEKRGSDWFLYFKKEKGAAGLPGQSQGKSLLLISGGIDSPVASYLMAKRGVEIFWLHFHSFPLVSSASIEKVKELAKVFLDFQPKLKVYFIPFSGIQKIIKMNTLAKYQVLLYRRLMFKIAEKIAKKEGCKALITGESLGQVSSQTLPNIEITQDRLKIPVFRPLIGMDKEEIISLAKKIKTFEISIKPQEDCCTLFVSKHQTGAGDIDIARELEKNLKPAKLILKALKETKAEIF